MPEDMNSFIRNARSGPTFTGASSNADINAALRQAAGYDVPDPTPQPESAELPRLAGADYHLRDDEPSVYDEPAWQQWMHTRPVIRLLDRTGHLPGERGYQRATSGPANPDQYDLEAAIGARRQRWHQRTGI